MKVLFFGTPQIAVPYLDWLINNHSVVVVVARKDEPVGRGYKITPPPTKVLAQEKNIPVFQPDGPWTPDLKKTLQDFKADVGVAVAYGRLIPQDVFEAPRLDTFNIHFSLLPKYRGAGPLQWSLINGDKETGVTAFWIAKEMDSGPICHQEKIPIDPADNAQTLREKLVPLGIRVLENVMKDLEGGTVVKKPQEGPVELAPMLKKEMGNIDWSKPAHVIINLIRGVYEWPVAHARIKEKNLKIFKATELKGHEKNAGTVLEIIKNKGPVVQAGSGAVLLEEVQPEGKKRMSGWAFWNGAHLNVGDTFQ